MREVSLSEGFVNDAVSNHKRGAIDHLLNKRNAIDGIELMQTAFAKQCLVLFF